MHDQHSRARDHHSRTHDQHSRMHDHHSHTHDHDSRTQCGDGRALCGEGRALYGDGRIRCGEGRTLCGEGRTLCGEGRAQWCEGRTQWRDGRARCCSGRARCGDSRAQWRDGHPRWRYGDGTPSHPGRCPGLSQPGPSALPSTLPAVLFEAQGVALTQPRATPWVWERQSLSRPNLCPARPPGESNAAAGDSLGGSATHVLGPESLSPIHPAIAPTQNRSRRSGKPFLSARNSLDDPASHFRTLQRWASPPLDSPLESLGPELSESRGFRDQRRMGAQRPGIR